MLLLQQLRDWWQGTLVLIGTNTGDAACVKKLCPLVGRLETQKRGFRLEKVCHDTRHAPLWVLYPKQAKPPAPGEPCTSCVSVCSNHGHAHLKARSMVVRLSPGTNHVL